MPSAIRLGRKSIAALVEYLESRHTWATLSHLIFKHGLEGKLSGSSKLVALGNLFYPLIQEDADNNDVQLAKELCEEITTELFRNSTQYDNNYASERYKAFQNALRTDGLDLAEGRIVPFLSPTISPSQEQGILESRLAARGFSVPLRHLEQANDNSARGNWEAANSQIRSFLESLCEQIAMKTYDGSGDAPTRGNARKYLEESGFLSSEESELLKAVFRVLHTAGGHAGTSSQDDCHRRRLIAMSLGNYYLDRLPT